MNTLVLPRVETGWLSLRQILYGFWKSCNRIRAILDSHRHEFQSEKLRRPFQARLRKAAAGFWSAETTGLPRWLDNSVPDKPLPFALIMMSLLCSFRPLGLVLMAASLLTGVHDSRAQDAQSAKTFIDYFLPMPITGALSKDIWGAQTVGPRDPQNGLEDVTMQQWNYWDGKILKGPDGKYHLFASRWEQSRGHKGWGGSKAVHAVSDHLTGPYVDKGLCWPDDQGGKGHNVTALQLPDGRYAIVVSETRPGAVFVSDSLDGPWKLLGNLTVEGQPKWRASNEIVLARPDGRFEMLGRGGIVRISDHDVLGPYVVQGL